MSPQIWRGLRDAALLAILITASACAHKPGPGELYMTDARTALEANRPDEARALAELALDEADTSERDALTLLASTHRALAEQALADERPEDAIAQLREAAAVEPATAQRRADLEQALTIARNITLPADRLQPLLSEALVLLPDDPQLHRDAARAFEELGRPEDAIAHYLWLWTASPGDRQAGLRLGVLLLSEGRHREALPYLSTLYEAHPDDLQVGLNLTDALEHLQRPSQATEVFEELLERIGEQPGLLFRYAAFLERQGRPDASRRMQERARDAMPALEQRDDMRPLR
ncbi:tetratricopeptide repeat protein [Lujinxingia vulgaris]|uniref:Tetratricopeptide repeat protein n=1 Tax=Lujinxingia vulgaris TaxID=2600176 RepID=A0A5C6XGK4_9DELT|nr:tetratricopeptide repeat protein [Lujinxingia vulgaris]TXD38563.1 tetratricopeptide repeat protein [Lujinxingia vulgaris]